MSKDEEAVNDVIARNLAPLMKGRSTEAVGKLADVSQKTVWNLLHPRPAPSSGKKPSPTLGALDAVCRALGVEVWQVLSDLPIQEAELISAFRKADKVGKAVILRAAGVQDADVGKLESALAGNRPSTSAQDKKLKH